MLKTILIVALLAANAQAITGRQHYQKSQAIAAKAGPDLWPSKYELERGKFIRELGKRKKEFMKYEYHYASYLKMSKPKKAAKVAKLMKRKGFKLEMKPENYKKVTINKKNGLFFHQVPKGE